MITIVTSFNAQGYKLYGRKFIRSFAYCWPKKGFELYVFSEGIDNLSVLSKVDSSNIVVIDLLKKSKACREFLDRHKKSNIIKGLERHPGCNWSEKAIATGYNYRYDAYKFCRKPFAIQAALDYVPDKLFWIDGDSVTLKTIEPKVFDELLPQGKAISYLARKHMYPECGLIGYDCDKPESIKLIHALADCYADDTVLNFDEWHDSYVWNEIRKSMKCEDACYPIPSKMDGAPFESCPLGDYMTHLKGDRKDDVDKSISKKIMDLQGKR